ncbi:hypothetical protein OCH239_01305 [Roseivivax halodurans JCM 10272]|uniref:Uncharacterized protein n=2 Tax=Roseivivax halodurans TaxID=93683 RepID=X7ENF1_9RHOB|nr:hypothetical protein OCH239_01305 [Roseivivax halodurans JCM 10272]
MVDSVLAAAVLGAVSTSTAEAYSARAGLHVFDSAAAFADAEGLAPGDVVVLLGRREALDGGGALWQVAATGNPDDICAIALRNGHVGRLAHQSCQDVRAAGVFPDTPGDRVAAALVALTRHVIAGGGGVIRMSQPIRSGSAVFPRIPERSPVAFEMVGGGQVSPADPQPGRFMWDFDDGGGITFPTFRNIMVTGTRQERPRGNGIRIGPSNRMTIANCFGRFIDGCAWQIEGANNAQIDIVTYECGSEDGTYAQNHLQHRDRNKGPNDIVLSGTTERDRYGINIEGAAILRNGSALKLHGSPHTRRALRLHRCNSFDLRVYASQTWVGDGFITVTDAGAEEAGLTKHRAALGVNSRGTLSIATMFNVRYAGRDRGHWCVVDLQRPGSYLRLRGDILPQAEPVHGGADYRHLRIAGPGHPMATIDLGDLRWPATADRARFLADDREPRERTSALAVQAEAGAPAAEIIDGVLDMRNIGFIDLAPTASAGLRRVDLEPGQTGTLCSPKGAVVVRDTDVLRLAGGKDFEMTPGSTLTLIGAGSRGAHEIARCER